MKRKSAPRTARSRAGAKRIFPPFQKSIDIGFVADKDDKNHRRPHDRLRVEAMDNEIRNDRQEHPEQAGEGADPEPEKRENKRDRPAERRHWRKNQENSEGSRNALAAFEREPGRI